MNIFTRKNSFSDRLKFDGGSFNEIIRLLKSAGFTKITIKIPEGYKNFKKKVFSPNEFIAQSYNFTAQILVAQKDEYQEVIKILFVNNQNSITSFNDQIFPSSHSVSSKYHIETSDPVRLIGLDDFVKSLLEQNSIRSISISKLQRFLQIFSTLYLMGWMFFAVSLLSSGKGFSVPFFSSFVYGDIISIVLLLASVVYLFFDMIYPGGLYVAPFEHPSMSFVRRIFVGDLKNNLILAFLIWIVKVALIGIVLSLVYNVIWALVGEKILKVISLIF